jgi:hypothetical protein
MAGRDRVWDGMTVARHISGTSVPSADGLREALNWLGERRPDHRLFCRLDRRRGRWVPVPDAERAAWIEQVVTVWPEHIDPTAPLPESWEQLAPDGPQMRIVVLPRSYAVVFNHGFGDYTYTYSLERQLIAAAASGEPPTDLLGPGPDHAVARAVWHTARRVGRPFASVVRARLLPSRGAGSEPAQQPADAAASPLVHRMTVVAPDARARLKELREAHSSSEAATLFALAVAAVGDADGPELPVFVLMDTRSALRAGAIPEGNFIAAVEVPRSEASSPAGFSRFTKQVYDSGRVVVDLAHAAAGQAVRGRLRRGQPLPAAVAAPRLTALTLSYVRFSRTRGGPATAPGVFNGFTTGPTVGSTLGLWFFSSSAGLCVGGTVAVEHADVLEAALKRISEVPLELLPATAP